MGTADYQRFANLTFDDFRRMAKDNSISSYEKIGFPDSYRSGKEELIFKDIVGKLPVLSERKKVVLDIGPGCSQLPQMLIELCRAHEHTLLLIDSEEMLAHLPDEPCVRKISGYYPLCEALFGEYGGRVDVILCYSVLHYIFVEANVWEFLDRSLELLAEGGEMLIGDIPNVSKRNRFFSSPRGVRFHQEFTGSQTLPPVDFNRTARHKIDDSVIMALLVRARMQGCDSYLLPQAEDLPMANRREDMLIRKP